MALDFIQVYTQSQQCGSTLKQNLNIKGNNTNNSVDINDIIAMNRDVISIPVAQEQALMAA